MPWGTIDGELRLRAQSSFANNRRPVMNFPGKQNFRAPAGCCFKFHKGGHCEGHAYSHNKCFKRDGNHRVNSCTFRCPSQPSAFTPPGSLRSCPLPIIPLCLSWEESMIHFFVGSYVKMPDSGLFSDWLRNNTSEKLHSDWLEVRRPFFRSGLSKWSFLGLWHKL